MTRQSVYTSLPGLLLLCSLASGTLAPTDFIQLRETTIGAVSSSVPSVSSCQGESLFRLRRFRVPQNPIEQCIRSGHRPCAIRGSTRSSDAVEARLVCAGVEQAPLQQIRNHVAKYNTPSEKLAAANRL